MDMISAFLRRPAAASVLSLIGVLAFYVIFGGVDLGRLVGSGELGQLRRQSRDRGAPCRPSDDRGRDRHLDRRDDPGGLDGHRDPVGLLRVADLGRHGGRAGPRRSGRPRQRAPGRSHQRALADHHAGHAGRHAGRRAERLGLADGKRQRRRDGARLGQVRLWTSDRRKPSGHHRLVAASDGALRLRRPSDALRQLDLRDGRRQGQRAERRHSDRSG